MNVNNYREFLERIGYHVVESESGYWFNLGPAFYENIPPFALISPSESEVDDLLWRHRMAGIKYCVDVDKAGRPSFLYVCEDKSYDLSNVQPRMRSIIRKGLKKCHARQIDFDYLYKYGMQLNRDTLARQRRSDSTFTDPAKWRQFCQAGRQVDGALTWGAFVGDELAAYMVAFIIDGYSNYLHQMSRTDLLPSRANHVLTYVATQEMLSRPDIHCVAHGQESIRNLPGLDEYKMRMGYRKRPMRYVVRLHPLVKSVMLGPAGRLALRGLERLVPDNDLLLRTRGIVSIAQHCYVNP